MVLQNLVRGGEPPSPRVKMTAMESQQRYIRHDFSAHKQTIGIPRVSQKIVREMMMLDEAVQSVGRLDDDSIGTRSLMGGESQRDEFMINNVPDMQQGGGRPRGSGQSNNSRVSKKSHRRSSSNIEEAVKKAILHSHGNEKNSTSVSNKTACPTIDFILRDLNRAAPIVQNLKCSNKPVPLTPRSSESIKRKTKEKTEQVSNSSPLQNPKPLRDSFPLTAQKPISIGKTTERQQLGSKVVEKDPFITDVPIPLSSRSGNDKSPKDFGIVEDWNPFEVNTFISSKPSQEKCIEPFPEPSEYVAFADFENPFIVNTVSL